VKRTGRVTEETSKVQTRERAPRHTKESIRTLVSTALHSESEAEIDEAVATLRQRLRGPDADECLRVLMGAMLAECVGADAD
jgi:hypothetical protein